MILAAQSLLGLFALAFIAWLLGENRRAARIGPALLGIAIQVALAAFFLWWPGSERMFDGIADAVAAVQKATRAGTALVFGYLGGAPLPFAETGPGTSFTLAFQALPIVLLFSALSALLFHWRVLPLVVRGFSWLLGRSMGLGGAVSVSTAANVFIGMVEAPLLVRPYLAALTRAELFIVMVGGMATIAGTVFGLYAAMLAPTLPEAAGHLLVASIISAPASIVVARLMVPETQPPTPGEVPMLPDAESAFEAVVRGTADGALLLINILATLVVMVALVALANQIVGLLPAVAGAPLTLERVAGWIGAPIAWLMGIPWAEAGVAGGLLGVKTVINEFLAYLQLAAVPPEALSPRSRLILLYGLCGFANFGGLGIMIGGLAAMVPERRKELVGLGLRSMIAGLLASCMTGAVIGVLTWS
ncbi:MAG: NupC/NupG family nucleoside CNT transporter [Alphaproteobacteria bacterium]